MRKSVPLDLRRDIWLTVSGGALLREENGDRFRIAVAGALKIAIDAPVEEQRAALHVHMAPTFGCFGPMPQHCLTSEGLARAHVAMCAIAHDHSESVFCPWVPLVVLACLHWMDEADTFFVVCGLLREPSQLIETRIAAWLMLFAFDELACAAQPRAFRHLCAVHGMPYPPPLLHEHPLAGFWLGWLARMPLPLLTRFVDVFISEGSKVVYRFGLVALGDLDARLKHADPVASDWVLLAPSARAPLLADTDDVEVDDLDDSLAAALTLDPAISGESNAVLACFDAPSALPEPSSRRASGAMTLTMADVLASIDDTDAFVARAFRLRFSRATVRTCMARRYAEAARLVNLNAIPRAPGEPVEAALLAGRAPQLTVVGQSAIMRAEQWRALQLDMPVRFHTKDLFLLFSTAKHGYSLTTLRTRAAAAAPIVMLVRTTDDDMFGAYCSYPWTHPSPEGRHFGNGETFVFRLSSRAGEPPYTPYPWVGTQRPVDASLCYFMRAQPDALTVGGSSTGAAIHLGSDLHGHSESCPTFASPSLVRGPTGQFAATLVEVWAFRAHR